jgi:hypothetical protein
MIDRKRSWRRMRSAMVGLMAMLLVILPLATSFAGEAGGSYSGDDAYDPAAGGTPGEAVKVLSANGPSPLPCALAEDEIASRNASRIPGGFSGDDAYDPAAGGTPELSLHTFAQDPDLIAACMAGASGN